jgi:hypothetical protein
MTVIRRGSGRGARRVEGGEPEGGGVSDRQRRDRAHQPTTKRNETWRDTLRDGIFVLKVFAWVALAVGAIILGPLFGYPFAVGWVIILGVFLLMASAK